MPYLIKQTSSGKWVARPGSEHSYTNDRSQAQTFTTAQEAQLEACKEDESIWFDLGDPVQQPWVKEIADVD